MCLSASVRILNLGFSTVTTPTSISEGSKSVDRTVDKHVIAVSTVCSNVQLNFFFTFFFQESWLLARAWASEKEKGHPGCVEEGVDGGRDVAQDKAGQLAGAGHAGP